MRVLVLGGTHHVGRAFVETALARGDEVTTLTRGQSGPPAPGVTSLLADRTEPGALAEALDDGVWDLVVDTWSQAPNVVRESARLLNGRAPYYCYISSRSVYQWPPVVGSDESASVVPGEPESNEADDYAAQKRGGEVAVGGGFDGDVMLARAGLILGPWERVGRMPFWLNRIAAGGRVPAPGPYDRPLQYVDARDVAEWVLGAQPVGTFNTVSEPGHTTMGELLELANRVTGHHAELVWVEPEDVTAAGVQPWTELPIWVPPTGELAGLHSCDVSAAKAAGLVCRPVVTTIEDTWAWLQSEGLPPPPSNRGGSPMDSAAEARLLAEHDAKR